MNWLNKLKTIQTSLPEVNLTLPVIPKHDLSKLSKVSKQDKADSYTAAPKKPDTTSAYCGSYHGHCSVRVNGSYPADCIEMKCEYYGLPNVPGKWGVYGMAAYCPEPTNGTTQHSTCPCCGGSDFWQSAVQAGVTGCRKCHPILAENELVIIQPDTVPAQEEKAP